MREEVDGGIWAEAILPDWVTAAAKDLLTVSTVDPVTPTVNKLEIKEASWRLNIPQEKNFQKF